MAEYERHGLEKALLHQVVREQLEGFLARSSLREQPTPRFIEQELRAFLRSLFAELRRRVRRKWGVPAEPCGAVTFIQRFGSALNLNVHFHTLALYGVYPYELGRGRPADFLPLPPPEPDEVARVLAGVARRIQHVIEARAADDADALERDEPLLALLTAASLRTRIATGPHRGEPWRRLGDRVDPRDPDEADADPEASERVPRYGGMSLHADVAVPARDRRRLERLAATSPGHRSRANDSRSGRTARSRCGSRPAGETAPPTS